jgi:hypothetical protein
MHFLIQLSVVAILAALANVSNASVIAIGERQPNCDGACKWNGVKKNNNLLLLLTNYFEY